MAKDPGGNTRVLYNFATGRHVKLDALSLGLYAAAPSRPDTAFARIASFGFKPETKISFDGLSFRDWMRGCEGAEQDALRAIKLCVDAGFPTRVQMNINRKNRDSILPSLARLDDMGVGRVRVIPTTPSTRWEMNAQGQSMDWGEFFHNNWPNRFTRALAPWKCLNQT